MSERPAPANVRCPDCGGKTRVVDCSGDGTGRVVHRKRRCTYCDSVVYTTEQAA